MRRAVRRAGSWLFVGAWAWLTVKPGSRPRRVARRVLAGLADSIVSHPRLARVARRLLAPFPAARKRLRTAIRNEQVRRLHYGARSFRFASGRGRTLDLSSETEEVRVLYQRLVDLRRESRSEEHRA